MIGFSDNKDEMVSSGERWWDRLKKKQIKLIVDVAMTVLLPMLMAYALIGEKFHEIVGTVMLLLFILHHILNRKWYPALFTPKRAGGMSGGHSGRKGKYSARRIFQAALDIILIVIMIMQPISGILMSKHLYTFIKVQGVSATARKVHMCLAYWGFVLMCVHAGTHLTTPFSKLRRDKKGLWAGIHIAWFAASVYGCIAFVKRNLADYMFRKTVFVFFDYSEPKAHFFLDYGAMMLLFMFAGYIVVSVLARVGINSIDHGTD